MNKLKVLSLDIASLTGWCLEPNLYGTWNLKTLKDESIGMKLIRFRAKLSEIHELEKLDVILYERAAGQHKSSIIHEAKMIGIVEEWCETNGVDYTCYSATEIKKFATGKGNAGKPAMIKAAKEKYGYDGDDDNEADAIHMRELFRAQIENKKV